MQTKQPTELKIGSVEFVTERYEGSYNDNNVDDKASISSLDVNGGEDVDVKVYKRLDGSWELLDEYPAMIHQDGHRVTLKTGVIESNNIKPGEKVRLELYERANSSNHEPKTGVLGTYKARTDNSRNDGVANKLHSESVWNYLQTANKIKYRNSANGKETTANAEAHKNRYEFSFNSSVRSALDVSPGDLIQIYPAGSDSSNSGDMSTGEKIDEIHEMLTELHSAFLNRKND